MDFEIKQENIPIDYLTLKDTEYYWDFSDGVSIDNEQISMWIKQIIEALLDADYGTHYSIGSGDTVIHGTKYLYGKDPSEGGYLEIHICKKYEELSIPLDTLIKK